MPGPVTMPDVIRDPYAHRPQQHEMFDRGAEPRPEVAAALAELRRDWSRGRLPSGGCREGRRVFRRWLENVLAGPQRAAYDLQDVAELHRLCLLQWRVLSASAEESATHQHRLWLVECRHLGDRLLLNRKARLAARVDFAAEVEADDEPQRAAADADALRDRLRAV